MPAGYEAYEIEGEVDPQKSATFSPYLYPLSDRNFYRVITSPSTGVARAKNWPKDFDKKGLPLLDRLKKGPAALIMTKDGLRYPVVCGGYQYHGQERTDRGINPIENSEMTIGAEDKFIKTCPRLFPSNNPVIDFGKK